MTPGATADVGKPTYLERLAARSAAVGTSLCLGLDPDPATLPPGYAPDVEGIERFASLVLDAALPHVAAVKPNLAFYEAFGSAGIAALERLRARIPADVPVLFDAKRGDIGNTAARQVAAIVDSLGGDAVTLNPYLGRDALEPFLARDRVFVYALCRTSNPGAAEVQGLLLGPDAGRDWPAEPLYRRMARVIAGWDSGSRDRDGRRRDGTAGADRAPCARARVGLPGARNRRAGRRSGRGAAGRPGRLGAGRRPARWGTSRERRSRNSRGDG